MARVPKKENKKSSKVGMILFLILAIGVFAGCMFSPVFNITKVTTEDGDNVTSGEVLSAANISLGENIFRINRFKAVARIEKIPYIKEAKIVSRYPDVVRIDYEERKPYANVKYLESFAITDMYGYVLEISAENKQKDLPIIYGLDAKDIKLGEKLVNTSSFKYENCAYLFETLYNNKLDYKISEVNYDDPSNVKLSIKDRDIDVIYGNINLSMLEEKVLNLSSILDKLGNKKGRIDMSDENYLAKTVFVEKK